MRSLFHLTRFFLRTTYFSPNRNLLIAVVLPILALLYCTKDLDRHGALVAMFVMSLTETFIRVRSRLEDGSEPGRAALALLPVSSTIKLRSSVLSLLVYAIIIQVPLTFILAKDPLLALAPESGRLRDSWVVNKLSVALPERIVERVVTAYGDTIVRVTDYTTDPDRDVTAKKVRILTPSLIFNHLTGFRFWPLFLISFFGVLSLLDGCRHFQSQYCYRHSIRDSIRSSIVILLQIVTAVTILADVLLPSLFVGRLLPVVRGAAPFFFFGTVGLLLAFGFDLLLLRPRGQR